MSATLKELQHFYWYCHIAAEVIATLPSNEATRAVSRNAVRMATLNVVGRKGIGIASDDAHRIKQETGKDWYKCGLIREHAVPVSEIHRRVVSEISRPMTPEQAVIATGALKTDMAASGLDRTAIDAFPANPAAWAAVRIIRALAHICWVSAEDDRNLGGARTDGSVNLRKSMPGNWDGEDPLARYKHADINVSPI